MENVSAINRPLDLLNNIAETAPVRQKASGVSNLSPALANLIAKTGGNFYNYIKSNGFPEDSEFIVISPNQHYYYDESDMRSVKSLINLNKLNNIKHLDKFLHNLYKVMQPGSNFIGCFSDSKKLSRNHKIYFYQPSVLLNRFRNFLDSKTDHYINRDEAFELLSLNGFKVINMTEINGLTYFYAQTRGENAELRA
ncbi:MAG: hypothetical protein ACOXZV_05645 [Bacteroidales bacterium]|jgi:hypothetical protein